MNLLRLFPGLAAATLMVVACGTDETGPGVDIADGGMPPLKAEGGADSAAKADAGDASSPPAAISSVGGTVSGLLGKGLVLQNNAGDDLPVAADGTFTFPKKLAAGAAFAVSIKSQPTEPSQQCTATSASGTMGAADVKNVSVTCVMSTFSVGGSLAGLAGTGLTLQNNLGDDLVIPAGAGSFTFATKLPVGGAYEVSIKTQPTNPTQTCTVNAGAGTVTNGNVSTVMLNCTTTTYAVGGTVTGLAGTSLVLTNNGGDDLTINNNGDFAFNTPVASGAAYSVAVKTNPTAPSQTCLVTSGAANVGGGPVTTVNVACMTNTYAVGGSATGVAGGSLTLQNNGGDDLVRNADGTFAFGIKLASGATYVVTVSSPPAGKLCVVTNGTGTVADAAVTNVSVTCTTCDGAIVGGQCWRVTPNVGVSCNTFCAARGGFNQAASTHTGNAVCKTFFPAKANGTNWETNECCSIDNNTNWGANGQPADGDWSHPACYVPCVCNN